MQTNKTKNMRLTGRKPRRRTAPEGQPKKVSDEQIVYTPAKPFNRNRFLLRLLTVTAVVLALVFGMSIFFKVRTVTVSGAEKYSAWEVKEASGISDGDALLSLSEAKISARIRTSLPYVDRVRVGIKLPDTVKIEITELDAVYAISDNVGKWWLLNVDGKVVDNTNGAASKGYTRIIGVELADPVVGQQAVAAVPQTEEPTGTETTEDLMPPVALIQPAHQLEAAITVLAALEANGVIGYVETIDVTDPEHIELWYEDRYQVYLGDDSRMEYKIYMLKGAVAQMGEYQRGQMDISFTTWPDRVWFDQFETEKS
ncbi:MAG: FtsQ-type POTRA domain-containing protein [Oscillospiraceae bacterium]|nr:FtsQ-type POTRA domain-containing protein [Oscillospiraceae bacterium]